VTLAAVAASSLAFAMGAFAAASLTLTTGTAPTFALTLTGADQTTTYTLPFTVAYTGGGTTLGWNVTATSTTFTNAAAQTFPANASTITSVAVGTCSGGGCNQPTNSITYPVALPAGATAPAAVRIFNAAAGTGKGTVVVTPTVDVAVPGNVFSGTYTSTITLTATTGP